jgi:hypothetical protein
MTTVSKTAPKVNYIKYTSFKDKYDNDQKFKERHQKYVLEKVNCSCGCKVSRSNLTSHQKTPKHIRLVEELNKKKQEEQETLKKMIEVNTIDEGIKPVQELTVQNKMEKCKKQIIRKVGSSKRPSIIIIIDDVVVDIGKIIANRKAQQNDILEDLQ